MIQTVWKRIKLIAIEALNMATNILTPAASTVCLLLEILCLPSGVIAIAKKVEYWLFQVGATKPLIEEVIETMDDKINSTTK